MVSFVDGERGSDSALKKRRMNCGRRSAEALTPAARQRHAPRHRKQRLMSKLGDSGFEEDLRTSLICSPARADISEDPEPASHRASGWFLQYGDIGLKIQREKEAQFYPCESLAHQPQLTAEARCKLVSWLVSVHKHFRLSFECCCLAVSIVDRFLASTPVAADCFQLLGVTALLLASKQVEMCSPQISHLLSLCCDAFTKEQLCNLECLVLVRLNFRLAAPTLAFFLDYFSCCTEPAQLVAETQSQGRLLTVNLDTRRSRQCSSLAQKVCELSLADYAFNKYPPSLTASCALTLASKLLETDFSEHAVIVIPENRWDRGTNKLHPQPAGTRPCETTVLSEGVFLAVKNHFGSEDQEIYNHNLAQECKDNLKLLVSLNQETLDVMSTM